MTYDAALHAFFNSFGMPAYKSTSVPDNTEPPFLTYETSWSPFGGSTNITVNIWIRTESEAVANAAATDLLSEIGEGGKIIVHDGGSTWIKFGSPLCQSLVDGSDGGVKRRYINLTAESFSTALM